MRLTSLLSILFAAAMAYGQSIVTPVFVHKDGEASSSGYTGSQKEILVDGGSQQVVGWITFQTAGVDFAKISSAKLILYVKDVKTPGTLGIYPLDAAITAPENNVPFSSIPVGGTAAATATVSLSTRDVEKMAQIDLTALVKAGAFHGVALVSDDGLVAEFDSKEGRLAPVILLTHDIESAAAKWHGGESAPEAGMGKDGDYHLNTATGDVSAKSGGAWSVAMNVVGATGATGPQGEKGDKGDQGDVGATGSTGPQGPIGLTGETGPTGATGPQGVKGDPGAPGADGRSIVWRGSWSADSSYSLNDAVTYLGNSYIGTQVSLNKNPSDSVLYWNVMALRGEQGVKGDTGVKGEKGDKGDTGDQGLAGADGHSPATTSTTSLTIGGSGNASFTFAGNRNAFGVGQRLRIASSATPANWMEGVVTAYNAFTGAATVARDNSAGSGTYSSWTVTVAGTFPSGTAVGDMQYWNGTQWMMIPAGQPGQALSLSGLSVPQWSQIPGTVTDIDGNVYQTIVIGNQEWTVTNLRTTRYSDGTAIPNVTDGGLWLGLTTGAYCYYNNTTDPAEQRKYGAFYNWYAVDDSRGLAPEGWRVPTDADWTALENYLIANGYNFDGTLTGNKVAKSMAAGIWTASTIPGAVGNGLSTNNKSGFSALAGGYRLSDGGFSGRSLGGYWWSATEYDASIAYYRNLHYVDSTLYRSGINEGFGFSVRLVRDLD